ITTLFIGYIALTSHILVAEDRHIHVNGECLESTEMVLLDQLIGGLAPNGYYWIDFDTGAWGYEGDQETQGYIGALAGNQTEPADSTSIFVSFRTDGLDFYVGMITSCLPAVESLFVKTTS
ncbi:MAG: hypothetical protein P8163_12460, partial [Candidatus Thiodiazotropha sp.]